MLQIKDTLVSLDLIERFFVCDLDACLGACCVEGDAGAPLAPGEQEAIEAVLDSVKDLLTPAALREIEENGVAYTDPDGDLVTSIVDGRDCVFTRYEAGGKCLCALESAFRAGRIPDGIYDANQESSFIVYLPSPFFFFPGTTLPISVCVLRRIHVFPSV